MSRIIDARVVPVRVLGLVACGVLLALLAACGGGGDDPGPPEASPVATSDDLPGGENPQVEAAISCGIADFAATALARINARRAAGASCGSRGRFAPAAALRWHQRLAQAASGHSTDMAAQNYFSHTSADGRTLSERVHATGYTWSILGENIAAGHADVDGVIDGWMRSDGHCANLMNPAFDEVGLACAPGASGSRYGQYWTQNLAAAR